MFFGPAPMNISERGKFNHRDWLKNPPFLQPKMVFREKSDIERLLIKVAHKR